MKIMEYKTFIKMTLYTLKKIISSNESYNSRDKFAVSLFNSIDQYQESEMNLEVFKQFVHLSYNDIKKLKRLLHTVFVSINTVFMDGRVTTPSSTIESRSVYSLDKYNRRFEQKIIECEEIIDAILYLLNDMIIFPPDIDIVDEEILEIVLVNPRQGDKRTKLLAPLMLETNISEETKKYMLLDSKLFFSSMKLNYFNDNFDFLLKEADLNHNFYHKINIISLFWSVSIAGKYHDYDGKEYNEIIKIKNSSHKTYEQLTNQLNEMLLRIKQMSFEELEQTYCNYFNSGEFKVPGTDQSVKFLGSDLK